METKKTDKKNRHLLGWVLLVVALAALAYGAYEAYTYGYTAAMPLIGGVLVTWLVMFGTMRLFAEKNSRLVVQVLVLVLEMAVLVALAVGYLGLLELLENMKAAGDVAFIAPGTSVWSVFWLFAYRVLIGYNCQIAGPQWLAHFPLTAAIAVWIIGALALVTLSIIKKKQAKREKEEELLSRVEEEEPVDDGNDKTSRVIPVAPETTDGIEWISVEENTGAPIDLTKIYAEDDEDPDATLDPTETSTEDSEE